ncbi:MAG: rhomboid family intramembrane serine protease [Gammaproteobacteria bacterium]|nr:rhomboid family intramembrane serine protease [Gammaproteobacteria bacterium]
MTRWARRLLVANVGFFLVTLMAGQAPALADVVNALVLVPALILERPWTILTYAFLHADFMHLLFNMIGLFFFGPRLENALGGGRFLGLYFASAATAAIASLFTPFAAIVGASGAVFGVLVGFAKYWPRDRIYFWGIVPIEARWFIVLLAVFSIWGGFRSGGGVAHFAHLGGLAGGWLYLKVLELRSPARRFRKKATPSFGRASAADLERWRSIPRDSLHPVNREELDKIMKKIDEHGPQSLDRAEREYLERLSPGK